MNEYWFNKLLDVLMVQTNSENEKLMVLYLDGELKRLKLTYYIDFAGNVIVTKGKAKTYPCVTSHMDTVHNFVGNLKIYKDSDNNDILFAMSGKRRVGIGGDDKCGVFACLYLLETMPCIKVVFFSREESGCRGSTAIDKKFFNDCRYLIQLDRRGKRDFIQTYWGKRTVSHDFSSEIGLIKKKHRYKNTVGTVTDVMKLWNNGVGVSCINLSCGYYMPHTSTEHISVNDLWNSIKFTKEIITEMKSKRYASIPPKPTVITTPTSNASYQSKYNQCCICKVWKKEALLYEVVMEGKTVSELVCWNCRCELFKSAKNGKTDNKIVPFNNVPTVQKTTTNDKDRVIYACNECGIKTSEMKAGDSLKYSSNGKMYCSGCITLFDVVDQEPSPKICYMCNKPIPKDQTPIRDEGADAATFGKYAYVCEDCNRWLDNANVV